MKKLLYGLIVLLLMVSCNRQEQEDEPLRVGMLLWPPYEFFYLADELGYYQGKNIELISYRTPSEVIRAYETELLDAVIVTEHLFLKMNESQFSDKVILVVNYSSGSDMLLSKPTIDSVSGLKGKKVGAEASTLGVFVMLRFLELHGLSSNDIVHVPLDVAKQTEAFRKNEVAGVVTYEPFATQIKNMGAVELVNSSKIPYEISDVLIASPKTIESKSDQLVSLSKGFFKALKVYRNNPKDYVSFLAKREEITPGEYMDALDGVSVLNLGDNLRILNDTESGYYHTLQLVNNKMIEFGLLSHPQNVEQLIDRTVIERVKNELE